MTDITMKIKEISRGEKISVCRQYKERTPPSLKLGDSMAYNRSRFPSYPNLPEAMKKLSKGAHWLFWQLLAARDTKTNIAKFIPKNPTEAKKTQRAYKELAASEILLRRKRGQYLFNPAVLEPRIENYEEIFIKWEDLKNN